MDGHIKEGCFKIIGYPDWFKSKNKGQQSGLKQQKLNGASGNKVAAMVYPYDLDTTIEVPDANSRIDELSNMLGSIQQKLQIMVKGKNSVAVTAVGHSGSTSYLGTSTLQSFTTFVGNLSLVNDFRAQKYEDSVWIVDKG
ncbi:hypothetical protein GH714_026619 [Hevea brasiliensis]|uniref:Uncharacterized protein n=1 Tax=Hevea brasiliensis TaxID=3981 RepID=A0A6A6KFQ3_HEVBR|nr:hypothetical protein GH714_026619 [Hevea brasiliensis]